MAKHPEKKPKKRTGGRASGPSKLDKPAKKDTNKTIFHELARRITNRKKK